MTEFWSASTQKLPVHYRQSIEVNVDLADDGGLGKALFFYPRQISSSILRSDKDKYFSACLGPGRQALQTSFSNPTKQGKHIPHQCLNRAYLQIH